MGDVEDARIGELTEAACLAAGFATAPPEVATSLGMSIHRLHGAVASVMTDDPTAGFWSRVIGLGLDEPITDQVIDDVVALYRDAGLARVVLQISPDALPEGWEQVVAAHGFAPGASSIVKLLRDTSPPPETETELELRQLTVDDAQAYGEAYWAAFGFPEPRFVAWMAASVGAPGWHHFGAFDGDRLVGGAALVVHGSTGEFYGAGTLPSDQRRGAQGLLMAARVRRAAELGLTHLVTEAMAETPDFSNPSLHNMRRYGFRELYTRRNLVLTLSEGARTSPET